MKRGHQTKPDVFLEPEPELQVFYVYVAHVLSPMQYGIRITDN